MNFGRSVVDTERPNIPVDALDNRVAGDADRAEDLQTAIDHATKRLGAKNLAHAGLVAGMRMLVEKPGGVPDRQPRHVQIDGVVGKHEADALMFADESAERMPASGMLGGN